jgi:uncharacterized membrane protein
LQDHFWQRNSVQTEESQIDSRGEKMERLDNFLAKYFYRIFWALSGIFLLMYCLLLGKKYIWMDESYTLVLIRHSFSDIWKITGEDVHPPLYYWYLKVVAAPFGYNMAVARFASVLPDMFILMFGGIQLRKYFHARTAVLFMVMYFCYPFAMAYSTEIRMYSLASAFVFACAVSAYKFWVGQGNVKNAIGLVLAGVLAAYTHYFAFVSVCIIYGELLIAILSKSRHLIRKWLGCVLVSVLLYLPWMPSFVAQLIYKSNNAYWIKKINLLAILAYVNKLFGIESDCPVSISAVYAAIFALAYLVCLIHVLSGKKKDAVVPICSLLVPVGMLAVGLAASVLIRPVFVIRYIVPAIPLMAMFMAIVLGRTTDMCMCKYLLAVVLMGGALQYGYGIYAACTAANDVPVEDYSDVDVYIVAAGEGGEDVTYTLGYYVTDKDIYYGGNVYGANPFPNIILEDYESDTAEQAILLVYGQPVPDSYLESYDIEYLGQWKCESVAEAYLLKKKE